MVPARICNHCYSLLSYLLETVIREEGIEEEKGRKQRGEKARDTRKKRGVGKREGKKGRKLEEIESRENNNHECYQHIISPSWNPPIVSCNLRYSPQ